MRHVYRACDERFDFAKGLYWIEPLLDATEYTISSIDASGGKDGFHGGDAFRPSINAYKFSNARALSKLATTREWRASSPPEPRRSKANVQRSVWQPDREHFVDRYTMTNEHVRCWEPVRGREPVGYLP
jgi:hypothetical protein